LLVFVFLLATAEYGQAQSNISTTASPKELYGAPKGFFVSPAEAEVILSSHVAGIKTMLENLTPGSPAYQVAYRASAYYRTIWYSVQAGTEVREAIMAGSAVFSSLYFDGASYTEKLNLRQESISMLSGPAIPDPGTH